MRDVGAIELYILKCASIRTALQAYAPVSAVSGSAAVGEERELQKSVGQFSAEVRQTAERMAEYYKLFYMLENDIRRLIGDTLREAHGPNWWNAHVPAAVKDECKRNQDREVEAGVTIRSDNELDYVSFGQLADIIRTNWLHFGGIFSNQRAMSRIMASLNMLRGPIAHCGLLAEDEIDRLKLTIRDWFRLLEGPK